MDLGLENDDREDKAGSSASAALSQGNLGGPAPAAADDPEAAAGTDTTADAAEPNRYVPPRGFEVSILFDGLNRPGGIALDPRRNRTLITEKTGGRILAFDADGSRSVWMDAKTPLYAPHLPADTAIPPLSRPEGIAYAGNDLFYLVEGHVNGRLISIKLSADGSVARAEIVELPGQWEGYAWEGVAARPDGALLVAGADADRLTGKSKLDVFRAALLYRDPQGDWWLPHDRILGGFSAVSFSADGTQAIYTEEFSGEIGWIDLTGRTRLGGFSKHMPRNAEGLCLLPDGSLLAGGDLGDVFHIDPGTDRLLTRVGGIASVDSLIWDPQRQAVLLTDDARGLVLQLRPKQQPDPLQNRMAYAAYQPIISRMHIPRSCPDFLERVMELGGIDFNPPEGHTRPPLEFRAFTRRIPLIAADALAEPLRLGPVGLKDPIEHIQFVVFQPNKRSDTTGEHAALAGFYARTASGKTITTRSHPQIGYQGSPPGDPGQILTVVPQASTVTVSESGVATVQLLGLGETPDFSIVISPRNPRASHLVSFNKDGSQDQYQLGFPPNNRSPENWVVAYADRLEEQWRPLRHAVQ